MITNYYLVSFILALILSMTYLVIWHRHFDIHMTMVFAFMPIVNLGYLMLAEARSLEAAILANKITYLGGCYLLLFVMLAVLRLCNFEYDRRINVALIVFNTLIYLGVLSIGYTGVFYKDVDYKEVNGVGELVKSYGPVHTVFYIMVIAYFIISLVAMAYSYFKRNEASNKIIRPLLITELITIVAFFGGRMITKDIEFVPIVYVLDQVVYLFISHRMCLYDITDTGIESLVQSGDTGMVSLDFQYNYLGSNKTAKAIFPELYRVKVDKSIVGHRSLEESMLEWIKEFEKSSENNKFPYHMGDKSYFVEINYLYNGKKKKGYHLFVKDNTREQEYISILNKYNANLQTKLEQMYESKGVK
ncbi:MAG: hypothetical protein IKQ83_02015 [Lachnospiraceae bacterium]|nr:hypothetical protein [Lachnospiraceae bacterium]